MKNFTVIALFFLLNLTHAFAESNTSNCVIRTEDPVVQQFYRANGFEVDEESGDFRVEFEVTCQMVDVEKDQFSKSAVNLTTIKLEVLNRFENQNSIYYTQTEEIRGARIESPLVTPCSETGLIKRKILEASLDAVRAISCDDEV